MSAEKIKPGTLKGFSDLESRASTIQSFLEQRMDMRLQHDLDKFNPAVTDNAGLFETMGQEIASLAVPASHRQMAASVATTGVIFGSLLSGDILGQNIWLPKTEHLSKFAYADPGIRNINAVPLGYLNERPTLSKLSENFEYALGRQWRAGDFYVARIAVAHVLMQADEQLLEQHIDKEASQFAYAMDHWLNDLPDK